MQDTVLVRYGTPRGRWVLLATVLGSGIAALDATVVNIALPAIGRDLHTGLTSLQWTVNAYTLTLAGFLLLGGDLGDRYGRRRMFVVGVVWFAVASLLCAVAPSAGALIGARALQGVGAALLTPGSLAIIEASFVREDRAAAIGAWSGLGGVAVAIGPFLGGYLVSAVSWRLIFLINLPLAAAVVLIAVRHVPESKDTSMVPRLDVPGVVLAALGLAGVTYALTEAGQRGWGAPSVVVPGLAGLACLAAFIPVERSSRNPLLPLDIFRSRQFSAANAVTFIVYAALGGALFLLPIQLQRVVGFSALESGTALVPITVVMLTLSARAGRLAQRIGPRLPMGLGPIVAGVGLALLTRVDAGSTYFADVLPAVVVFGLGLALTVAPLSAVNNDVARAAGLVAVAVLPLAAGITSSTYAHPAEFSDGFRMAMMLAAALCAAGGVLALLTIRNPDEPAESLCASHCSLDAPPLGEARAAAS
jgi:EmrB/QacA subfamily drug resistance transporter